MALVLVKGRNLGLIRFTFGAKLHGGVAQGAPSSPTFFTFALMLAAEYSNSLARNGFALVPKPSSVSHQVPSKRAFEDEAIERVSLHPT